MTVVIVLNQAKGPRGVQAAAGVVYLQPGESREMDVPEVELPDMLASGDFSILPDGDSVSAPKRRGRPRKQAD